MWHMGAYLGMGISLGPGVENIHVCTLAYRSVYEFPECYLHVYSGRACRVEAAHMVHYGCMTNIRLEAH